MKLLVLVTFALLVANLVAQTTENFGWLPF